ncbi:MAG: hypothetical protein EBV32_04925 [Proteobacteria bacterium]|uniref:SF4 helicase domain-containing protein n=1 Tax=Candidatus Fonsibacter lacus TaxID=2576439 RepID=A0A964XS44_9PROT|nr:hypothetical protein [Candidatus Fonsibacter lacus]NBP60389.1 hypothetical protein [Pseudomonadota bacterium]NCU72508.1 hypothetical protein [Candidatus Fonsibacter lacus]
MKEDFFCDPSEALDVLDNIREGRVKMGLGIGDPMSDQYLRYKQGQFVMINGADNTGKTTWILWYFVVLALKHKITFDIFSAENSIASLKRDIMQFMTGKELRKLSDIEYRRAFDEMNFYFKFIRNDKTYTVQELLKISAQSPNKCLLIDPWNSLRGNGGNKHEEDYDACGDIRVFCNTTKKSVYVNAHLVTEAARKKFPKDHEYEGHQMPPSKSDTEGGQKFANRCDDFITIHRMTQFEARKNFTEVHVRKVKETITGGGVTQLDRPIIFKFWNYTRFEVGERNPIANETGQGTPVQQTLSTLNNKKNEGFETESVQKDADDFPF